MVLLIRTESVFEPDMEPRPDDRFRDFRPDAGNGLQQLETLDQQPYLVNKLIFDVA